MDLVRMYGLPIAVLLVFIAELGVPGVPNEIPLLLVGAYDIHSPLALAGAIAAVGSADLLGTTGLFLMMRSGGSRLTTRLLKGRSSERMLTRWRSRIGRSWPRDVALVVGGRLLPLLRTPFTMTMGVLGLQLRRYIFGALPGAFLWAGGPILAGYLLRHRVDGVIGPLERGITALGIGALALIALIAAGAALRTRIGACHHASIG